MPKTIRPISIRLVAKIFEVTLRNFLNNLSINRLLKKYHRVNFRAKISFEISQIISMWFFFLKDNHFFYERLSESGGGGMLVARD